MKFINLLTKQDLINFLAASEHGINSSFINVCLTNNPSVDGVIKFFAYDEKMDIDDTYYGNFEIDDFLFFQENETNSHLNFAWRSYLYRLFGSSYEEALKDEVIKHVSPVIYCPEGIDKNVDINLLLEYYKPIAVQEALAKYNDYFNDLKYTAENFWQHIPPKNGEGRKRK